MGATIPNTFTTGTKVEALKLQENQEAVRKYINKDIVYADLADECVDYQELTKGEYHAATRDHQFTTGDMLTHFSDLQIMNRSYVTGELKQIADYTNAVQYITIANSGKRFYLETDALVIYHAFVQFVISVENLDKNQIDLDQTIFLRLDNTNVNTSYALCFSDSPSSANAGGDELTLRRSYPICYIEYLTAGWHDISLVIDMRTQQGYAGAKNVTIEQIMY